MNSLNGLSDKVLIKISDNEEISNIRILAKKKYDNIEDIKQYIKKELLERDYTINELLEYVN